MAAVVFQQAGPQGRKHSYEEDEGDGNLPQTKRRRLVVGVLHPALHPKDRVFHHGHIAKDISTDSNQVSYLTPVEGPSIPQLEQQCDYMSIDGDFFPQFSRFPPEIRRMIWQHTWEHRLVSFTRRIIGTLDNQTNFMYFNDGNITGARQMRQKHVRNTQLAWRFSQLGSQLPWNLQSHMAFNIVTRTCLSRFCNPPVSLWVNGESRDETLRHFQPALGCALGQSTMYFNFNLDILDFPLHSPLSTAFSMGDLSRLRRLSIPELVPTLPSFKMLTGRWDDTPIYSLRKTYGEIDESIYYAEFRKAWRLLRRSFPELREIYLTPFHQCKRYDSTKAIDHRGPLDIESYSDILLDEIDRNCHSCMNIQSGISTRFHPIGVGASRPSAQEEFNMVLDHHNIMAPVIKQRKISIGRAPRKHRNDRDEDVIVTYYGIHDAEAESAQLNLQARTIDWAAVRRQCIARTLERAFGPPTKHEYMVYFV
ncbi:hypothetical protein F4779DRAFT_638262 [Xylariaceae sp. FL0662B]|nr:hypothetical protein F4779DRAFT_638262 [Xylariaceae sp. FL0662B]